MAAVDIASDHRDLILQIAPYTKSSHARMLAMLQALEHIDRKNIRGAIVECGIWRGGNLIMARKLCPQRTVWGYDTFTGMPDPGEFDRNRRGSIATIGHRGKSAVSRAEVEDNLRKAGCWDHDRVRLVAGQVEDTLLEPRNLPSSIALLRLDTDWHASTKIELQMLYPRLERGGVLIVDDYGHWMGARKAVDDYFAKRPLQWRPIDYTAVMAIKQ